MHSHQRIESYESTPRHARHPRRMSHPLGAIVRLIGLDAKHSATGSLMDEHADHEDGGQRPLLQHPRRHHRSQHPPRPRPRRRPKHDWRRTPNH